MDFAFTNGHGAWDSNDSHNYTLPIRQPKASEDAASSAAFLRTIASQESYEHAEGMLHIITLEPRRGGDAAAQRAARWTEEKRLRVWTPPGYDPSNPPPGGYPVLYMHDGQNKFEDWLAHQVGTTSAPKQHAAPSRTDGWMVGMQAVCTLGP